MTVISSKVLPLSLLVIAGDKHATQQALSAIRRAMRLKCKDIKLSSSDTDSAIAYAQELFAAAVIFWL
ncbi:hypothetical protein ACCS68_18965 [Rhizobium beringeri]|uniref:hypothetical protein n=1 Tax=Rhizobium beringeri TaxID=3019934 RepID=UPI003CEC735D